MFKFNTITAAAVSLCALTAPAFADGFEGHKVYSAPKPLAPQVYAPAHAPAPAPMHQHSYSSHSGYATSGHGYQQTVGTTHTNTMSSASANSMVACVMNGQEIPCSSVPGLSQSLISQGRADLAQQVGPSEPLRGPTQFVSSQVQTGFAVAPSAPVAAGIPAPGGQFIPVQPGGRIDAYICNGQIVPANQMPAQQAFPVCNTQQVVTRQAITTDLSGSTIGALYGGVGYGVYGGYSGGGGAIITSDRQYSGVLQSSAAQFTFNQQRMNGKNGFKGGKGVNGGKGVHGGRGGKGYFGGNGKMQNQGYYGSKGGHYGMNRGNKHHVSKSHLAGGPKFGKGHGVHGGGKIVAKAKPGHY